MTEKPQSPEDDIHKKIIKIKKETGGDILLKEVLAELEEEIRGKLKPKLEEAIEKTEEEEPKKTLQTILDVLNRDPEEALRLLRALGHPHKVAEE